MNHLRSKGKARLIAAGVLALALGVSSAYGQSGRNVLVVVNGQNPDSVRIGEYYAKNRAVPSEQLLRLTTLEPDPPDGIDHAVFEREIQSPIAAWLGRHQAQDRILFIVLTKGIPLRINAPKGQNTAASVDSELALLYERLLGTPIDLDGPLPNPLFVGDGDPAKAERVSRQNSRLYLVTRLDGYTVADVLGLIDRAAAPSADGRFLLDGKQSLTERGNVWLKAAADRLVAGGLGADRVQFDNSATVIADQVDVLGYYSWGSNDPLIRRRDFNLKFRNGAIAGMFVSTDGRTFKEPPANWTLPTWANKEAWFAGSPQSLAGDLIRAGVTGVAGHVAEPLLGNTIRPDILFPSYMAGMTLAEAYYRAMPSLSWMTVVVGDPLCAPFQPPQSLEEIPLDPATELPAVFSTRKLEQVRPGIPREVRQTLLLAESRLARGDRPGHRLALERATAELPSLVPIQLQLATLYEAADEYDAAIARYRLVLEQEPNSVVALNNLAYALATRHGALAEAQVLAERARKLAPRAGSIADTLGWIYFIAGDRAKAMALLTEAVTLTPGVGEIWAHLAEVSAASGDLEAARKHAEKAVSLSPELATRAGIRDLLARR